MPRDFYQKPEIPSLQYFNDSNNEASRPQLFVCNQMNQSLLKQWEVEEHKILHYSLQLDLTRMNG